MNKAPRKNPKCKVKDWVPDSPLQGQGTLQQLLDWTVPRIAVTLQERTDEIAARAEQLGLTVPSPDARAPHMLGLELPPDAARRAAAALAEEGVVVSMRGSSLRIAPHLHINQEDVDRLMEALASAVS